MKKLLSIFLLVSAAFAAPTAYAQGNNDDTRLTVIELFTSQGCSSCPPADSILKTIRDRPNMLTLSWAVDYWNRLGWEDTFSNHYNTMRQTAYNKRLGRGGVFTPQMIVDGRIQCVGSKKEKVRHCVKKAQEGTWAIAWPTLTPENNALTLTLAAHEELKMVAVRVVWYLSDATVEIGDGENQGRTLHYTNIVLGTSLLDEWDGTERTYVISETAPEGADHVAILLQNEYGHGPIVGAVSMALESAE